MTDSPLAVLLAETAAGTTWDSLPTSVRAATPGRVLDVIGLSLAALDLDTSRAVLGHVADAGGAAQASAIGLDARVPAGQAALVNGVLPHSLDWDDTHLPSILHPSSCVVPAALAAAEWSGASGAVALTALVVGVEVTVRLGMAGYDATARQSVFFEHGQHATSICGTVGAAVAAATAMGLDATATRHALGIACSMGAGVIEGNRTGGTVKRMHCGWAAHAGVVAADLARRGVTGPPTALEGRFGFFEAWLHGTPNLAAVTDGLGSSWAVASLHVKPYPANHFTHAVADAAMELSRDGLGADDIASVDIGVASPTVRTIGEPIDAKRRPESGYHARFSAPYVFAAALSGGSGLGLGLGDFTDERVCDPERQALMDRVTVHGDAACDAVYPDAFPAVVTVTDRHGRVHTVRVFQNRGGPQRPLTDDELRSKFIETATQAIPAARAHRVADAVRSLPSLGSVRPLFDCIRED